MNRLLTTLLLACLSMAATAQEIPGVRVTLSTPRSIVAAGGSVDLRLLLEVKADAEVPGELLTGMNLQLTVDEQPGPVLLDKGKGGTVNLLAGTRLERTLSIPASRMVPQAKPGEFSVVAIAWAGLAGVHCVVKVAPDASGIDLDALDLTKTKVVLVTNRGEMTLSFRPDKAPQHVRNFLALSMSGFYDGTKFHRVIRNFMIQGGDPNTKDDAKQAMWGQGGSGKNLNAEFSDIKHVRGTLSMARSQDPNSASSQFFIVHKDSTHLDNSYTAFGNLEAGADTLDAIASTPCAPGDRPLEPVILHAVVILPVKK